MTQPAPPRQPGSIWDRSYQEFSKSQHARVTALGARLTNEPVPLKTLGETVMAEVRALIAAGDAMAETRYKELAAERDALESQLTGLLAEQTKADEEQTKLKKAMTDKGIKLP